MKKFFTILILSGNGLAIIGLLLAAFSTKINPDFFFLPALLGMFFLPLILLNLAFVVFWMLRFKWFFVFSLLAIVLSYGSFKQMFPIKKSATEPFSLNDSTQFTLLSYNVKLFDFYKKSKNLQHHNKTIEYILNRDADIVCLQEFGYYNAKGYLDAANVLTALGKKYKYRHIESYGKSDQRSTYGVATFSKYPIVKKRTIEYETRFNFSICSEIQIRNKTIHLYNCHLESNQLTVDDKKKMFELVDSVSSNKEIALATGLLFGKLKKASKARSKQAKAISDDIAVTDSLVVVCGDFNDTPVSYTYGTIKGDLSDAFLVNSSGLGITYSEAPFLFRIDYILHSKGISSGNFFIDKVPFSDHYPISCVIDLK